MKVIAIEQALLKFINVYIYLQSYYLVFLKNPLPTELPTILFVSQWTHTQEESVDFIG